jgi:hypothetical protein
MDYDEDDEPKLTYTSLWLSLGFAILVIPISAYMLIYKNKK